MDRGFSMHVFCVNVTDHEYNVTRSDGTVQGGWVPGAAVLGGVTPVVSVFTSKTGTTGAAMTLRHGQAYKTVFLSDLREVNPGTAYKVPIITTVGPIHPVFQQAIDAGLIKRE